MIFKKTYVISYMIRKKRISNTPMVSYGNSFIVTRRTLTPETLQAEINRIRDGIAYDGHIGLTVVINNIVRL